MSELDIALLSPCFWPEVRRGAERIVRDLADDLLERGQRPTLITSHPGRPSSAVEDGLPVIRNWRPPQDRLVRRQYEEYMTHVPLSYLSLVRGDYDIAHAIYPTDALAAARWSRREGRPSVLTYMGVPTHEGLTWRRRRLEITQSAVDGCDATVVLSRAAAEGFQRWLGVDARVIHPGVDLEGFTPGDGRAAEPTIVCAAAADAARKRVDMLARAFVHVRRERPEARLVLVRPEDPALAESLRGPGVELADLDAGEARKDALADAYRGAWVSALPSVGEAFGLVLLEALACGTPVVATDEGGMSDIVNSDTVGRLFEGDERALARALLEALELAEDPATPAACRARAEDFSTGRSADEYLELYRGLLAR